MLKPVVVVRLNPANRSSSILERDGVRGQNGEAYASKRRPEGLKGIADQAGYLTLAEVELPIVLVKDNHTAEHVTAPRCEQESRDDVAFQSPVPDPFPVESDGLFDVASLEFNRNRVRKPQQFSKRHAQVSHHQQ
ncbi:hypothetical protein [Dokdonella sp.]|uniref:hypothetical protein n=1 Tax=Dokdonella sp. TaxID=2291710 RepID=UPI0035286534